MSELKTVPLPYIKSGERFKLEVSADKILISRLGDASISISGFPSQNRVECSAEIYYDIIIRYAVNKNFTIELRIDDQDVDHFCDFFLNTFCSHLVTAPGININPYNTLPRPMVHPHVNLPPVIYPKTPKKITDPYCDCDGDDYKDAKDEDLIRRIKNKYIRGAFKNK